MQGSLSILGLILLFLNWRYLPETSHPGSTGLEKAKGIRKRGIVLLNPFRSLPIMLKGNLFLVVSTFLYSYGRVDFFLIVFTGGHYVYHPNTELNHSGNALYSRMSLFIVLCPIITNTVPRRNTTI